MEAADVFLMSDELNRLPYAIQLVKSTVQNMKQNTVFALLTVALLLVGVLRGDVHLASGTLIHEISVLLVILNAVRMVAYPKYLWTFKGFKLPRSAVITPDFGELVDSDSRG